MRTRGYDMEWVGSGSGKIFENKIFVVERIVQKNPISDTLISNFVNYYLQKIN